MANVSMWILWPGFLMAGVAELVFFALVDPQDLHLFGQALELSRTRDLQPGLFLFLDAHVRDQRADLLVAALAIRNRLLPSVAVGAPVGRMPEARWKAKLLTPVAGMPATDNR